MDHNNGGCCSRSRTVNFSTFFRCLFGSEIKNRNAIEWEKKHKCTRTVRSRGCAGGERVGNIYCVWNELYFFFLSRAVLHSAFTHSIYLISSRSHSPSPHSTCWIIISIFCCFLLVFCSLRAGLHSKTLRRMYTGTHTVWRSTGYDDDRSGTCFFFVDGFVRFVGWQRHHRSCDRKQGDRNQSLTAHQRYSKCWHNRNAPIGALVEWHGEIKHTDMRNHKAYHGMLC